MSHKRRLSPYSIPPMAAIQNNDNSSDDEGGEAPESISLSSSKRSAQQHTKQLVQAEIAQRAKKRAKNRKLDEKFKARAETNKKQKVESESSKGSNAVEMRMKRAMQDAEQEEEMGMEMDQLMGAPDDESSADGMIYETFEGIKEDASESGHESETSSDNDENDDDESDDDPETEEIGKPQSGRNPNHLPDEYFAAAFKTQASASKNVSSKGAGTKKHQSRKRKRANAPPKDVIIGSRAIRTLSNTGINAPSSATPSRKIEKFIDRTLALKGRNPKARGWERRPVNIGILRRNGPAANFTRQS